MERMCGMLIPLVKSQIHPYASLWNNIILNERFNHLKFNQYYKQIFPEEEEEREYPSHRVFSSSLYEEELYSPSKVYKHCIHYVIDKLLLFIIYFFFNRYYVNIDEED